MIERCYFCDGVTANLYCHKCDIAFTDLYHVAGPIHKHITAVIKPTLYKLDQTHDPHDIRIQSMSYPNNIVVIIDYKDSVERKNLGIFIRPRINLLYTTTNILLYTEKIEENDQIVTTSHESQYYFLSDPNSINNLTRDIINILER